MSNDFGNGLVILDDDFNVICVNEIFKKMYPDIKIGKSCYELLYCDGNNKKNKENFLKHLEQKFFGSHISNIEIEGHGKCYCIIIDPNKEEQNYEISDNPQKLYENSILWNNALNNMPNGYYCYIDKKDLPIIYVSDRFCEILGYTREEISRLFDNKMVNMIHHEYKDEFYNFVGFLKRNESTGKYTESVYRIKSKEGYIWVLDSTKLIYEGDRRIYQSAITDITSYIEDKQKNNENLLKIESKIGQYKKAIISGASSIYEVNVTKDILENVSFFEDGKEYSASEIFDVTVPCKYSWYISKISEKMLSKDKKKVLKS